MTIRFTLLICLITISQLFAQPGRNGAMGGGGQMPAVGKIYGKVQDAGNKAPVAYATVTLLNMRDSLIGGALVKANGDFSIDKLRLGKYKLKIQFVGYKPHLQTVSLTPGQMDFDLGNIRITQNAAELNEVVVQGQKQAVNMSIDKRTYNVEKDISIVGGTGLDVMKNLPGVTVDGEGNVTLRNGSPIIFIDGRPSVMTLEQIPAEQIEKIEIITNPSARYDAASNNGILNVILKKNSKPGYNGMINAGAGTNNRLNSMVNLNIKEKSFNVFMSYNFNMRGNINNGYTYRTNLKDEEITSYFNQDNVSDNLNFMQFGRFGFDWNMSNRNMITVSQAFNIFDMRVDDVQNFDFQNSNNSLLSSGKRITDQSNIRNGYTSQVQFKHTFPKPGKELLTDFTLNLSDGSAASKFNTENYNLLGVLLPNNPEIQRNNTTSNSTIYTYQLDYTNPLTDTAKLEMGVKSNLRTDRSLLGVRLGSSEESLILDTLLSNNYQIDEFINAVYINYSNMFGKYGYMAGVRFEQTHFTGELLDKDSTFQYIYPNGTKNLLNAFFPSIYLNRRYGINKEVQLNFSRKINRPGWMQVVPFIMFADRQSYRIGNPNLAPEFINTIESNYNHIFKWGSFLTSAYFKLTENAITNYVFTYFDPVRNDSSILVSTFINGDKSFVYGWENTAKFNLLKKKMDITLNWHVFYTDISAQSTNSGLLQNRGISWNTKAILSYKLPFGFAVQINGSYEAPRIIPQGRTLDVYSMDISLAKEFNKKFSMNFTVNDVFNTKRWGALYETANFNQDFSRRWESRYARLTFSWRFGEMDQSLFRKRNTNKRDRDSGGEQMEF
jgi:outer membrane cobalamin receptor